MDAIEKRARELLAAEYSKAGGFADPSTEVCAVRAIIAALTPPESYVLVPVEPTVEMIVAGNEAENESKFASEIYGAMLDARPEVP